MSLVWLDERTLATRFGDFRLHRFRNPATRDLALAAVVGVVGTPAPLLARVHSSCVTSEAYGACDCDCAEQLAASLAEIAGAGRGVLFYLMQEGRGAGFAAKARDRMLVQASRHRLTTFEAYEQMGLGKDQRRYGEVAAMRRLLGITAPFVLLSNNPDKITAIEAEGVPIDGVRSIEHRPSPWSFHYITAKQRSGHALSAGMEPIGAAELPEEVESFEPYRLDARPAVLHVASYLLPVRDEGAAAPCWFRLHLYRDEESATDRVVLDYRGDPVAAPFVAVCRESLEDRFPLRVPSEAQVGWRRAISAIKAAGAGCIVFRNTQNVDAEAPPRDDLDDLLVSRHLAATA